jgi:outer membrane protein assembly factor BamB
VYSSPTVVGELLIVSSCNGFIRALDKKTGEVRWSYEIHKDGDQREFHGDPLVTEKLMVVGTDGDMGHLYAFEPQTGAVRWKYRVEWRGLASDVVRSGDNLYALTLGDELVCVDLKSGQANWTFRSSAPPKLYYWNSSPVLVGERVYFGGMDGVVYSLNARDGKMIWKSDFGARVSTSIAAHGSDLYVGTADRHLHRLDADSGKVLADLAVEAEPRWRLIVARDSVLVFLGPQSLASVDFSLKKVRWSAKALQNWMSARPYVWHDMVLAGDGRELIAFRASDGVRAWSYTFPGTVRGIGVTNDVLYVGTLKGPIFALSVKD